METKLDHALALAAQGFWVFPLRSNSKLPLNKGWQDEATCDPDQIKKMDFVSRGLNVGIFTSRFGQDNALLVVDVDMKEGKNGDAELFRLEMEGRDFPPTREVTTATGGRHLIYSTAEPVKQGANVIGDGLDIRSRGGFIVGAGSTIDGAPYRVSVDAPVVPAPAWLVDHCGVDRRDRGELAVVDLSGVDAGRARRRAVEYLTAAEPSVEGQGGDETAYKVACRVKDFGVDATTAVELLDDHWNPRCLPPWDLDALMAKVNNAYAYGVVPAGAAAPEVQFPPVVVEPEAKTAGGPIQIINREYAFVRQGAFVLHENTDEFGEFKTDHLNLAEFHGWFANKTITMGKKTMPQSQAWIEWPQRREYEAVVFAPQQNPGPRWYNMWRGFTVAPAASADHPSVDAFKEHALKNTCDGDAKLYHWLMSFFAHMIQRPYEKPLVALVFKGKKGTGKNALVERVGRLLGAHFRVTDDGRYLTGNFNSHFEANLFFVLDEAHWAGDKRAEGKLKGLITGAKHSIERKGKEPYEVRNLSRIAIIGNEDWLVPASSDERRFAVFNVGDGRIQDRKFFIDMREGMEAGGYGALLRFLLDYDISGVDLNDAPATAGLAEQKEASLEPLQQWWLTCLTDGRIVESDFGSDWPAVVDRDKLRESLGRYWKARGIRAMAPDSRMVGKALKSMLPGHGNYRGPKPDQRYHYRLPDLAQAREEWDRFMGFSREWE